MIVSDQPGVTTLAIHTLGTVAIELHAAPVVGAPVNQPDYQRLHFATRTVEALLIYLVCQGRPLGRDVLAELLWPRPVGDPRIGGPGREGEHLLERHSLAIGGHRVGAGAGGEDDGQDGPAHGGGSEAAASVQRASL